MFFIGAALGKALAPVFGVPTGVLAALGFVAVFAGAANTPLACTFMGIELFGATYAVLIAVACFVAYLCSGHSGIYLSQRIAIPKVQADGLIPDATLRNTRAQRSARRRNVLGQREAGRAEAPISLRRPPKSFDDSRLGRVSNTDRRGPVDAIRRRSRHAVMLCCSE